MEGEKLGTFGGTSTHSSTMQRLELMNKTKASNRTETGSCPVFTARKPRKEAQQGPKSRPERGSGEKGKDRLTTALATRGEHLGTTHI